MDKIEVAHKPTSPEDGFESAVLGERDFKEKFKKGFINYAGLSVGIALVIAVIIVELTNISFNLQEAAVAGLKAFLLFFCSYTMYVNSSDSGMRQGYLTNTYKAMLNEYNALKNTITAQGLYKRMDEFCRHYVKTEVDNTRIEILASVGIDYDEYKQKYMGLDKKAVDALDLSDAKKHAIKDANQVKPIKLTTEMLMRRQKCANDRNPIGVNPALQKKYVYIYKVITTAVFSLFIGSMVIEVMVDPNWGGVLASCVIRVCCVVVQGALGYKFGFENIVINTVDYMSNQAEIINRALQYFADNPIEAEVTE
jgi:hypothetical protein